MGKYDSWPKRSDKELQEWIDDDHFGEEFVWLCGDILDTRDRVAALSKESADARVLLEQKNARVRELEETTRHLDKAVECWSAKYNTLYVVMRRIRDKCISSPYWKGNPHINVRSHTFIRYLRDIEKICRKALNEGGGTTRIGKANSGCAQSGEADSGCESREVGNQAGKRESPATNRPALESKYKALWKMMRTSCRYYDDRTTKCVYAITTPVEPTACKLDKCPLLNEGGGENPKRPARKLGLGDSGIDRPALNTDADAPALRLLVHDGVWYWEPQNPHQYVRMDGNGNPWVRFFQDDNPALHAACEAYEQPTAFEIVWGEYSANEIKRAPEGHYMASRRKCETCEDRGRVYDATEQQGHRGWYDCPVCNGHGHTYTIKQRED